MEIPGVILASGLKRVEPDSRRRRRLLRDGTIRAVGQWYVTAEAPADLLALLILGVRPTCLDAAALHGLWVPLASGVHAYRPRAVESPVPAPQVLQLRRRADPVSGELVSLPEPADEAQRRATQPVVLHRPRMRTWPDDDPVPDLLLALDHAARCLPTVKAAILIESAMNQRKLTRPQLVQLLEGLPQKLRIPLSRVRSDAQSGTETAVRWWLEERCVRVRSQVQLAPRVELICWWEPTGSSNATADASMTILLSTARTDGATSRWHPVGTGSPGSPGNRCSCSGNRPSACCGRCCVGASIARCSVPDRRCWPGDGRDGGCCAGWPMAAGGGYIASLRCQGPVRDMGQGWRGCREGLPGGPGDDDGAPHRWWDAPCRSACGRASDQPFGSVMDSTSSAESSCSSVSSPRSTKPSAITASRTGTRSATACLAIFAADS